LQAHGPAIFANGDFHLDKGCFLKVKIATYLLQLEKCSIMTKWRFSRYKHLTGVHRIPRSVLSERGRPPNGISFVPFRSILFAMTFLTG
jgi:hypothetical protein